MVEHEALEPMQEAPARAPEIPAPVIAPGMGIAGATMLARSVGNRAFARAVASPGSAPPPAVGPAPPIVGAASARMVQRQPSPAAPNGGGGVLGAIGQAMKQVQRQAIQAQRDQNLRIRNELMNQVLGQIATARGLMDRDQPNLEAVVGVAKSANVAINGFGLPDQYSGFVMAMRDAVAQGINIAVTMKNPRGEMVQVAKDILEEVAGSIDAALATPAPAPAAPGDPAPGGGVTPAPAPAPSPAPPPPAPAPGGGATPGAPAAPGAAAPSVPADQEAALRSVAQQVRVAGQSLGQGTRQQVDDVILILGGMPVAVESAAAGAPAHMREHLTNARNKAKAVITVMESLKRSEDENKKAAVAAFGKAMELCPLLFVLLQVEDKKLEAKLAALDAPGAGGPNAPAPAPAPAPRTPPSAAP